MNIGYCVYWIVTYKTTSMNKLIVVANPSTKWFSHRIASRYLELSENNWDKVEIIDLYKTALRQDFLNYERKRDIWSDEITGEIQKKILWADKTVLIFPIWWADAPAIMKNFFDCNFTSWFAYKRVGRSLKWLLSNKSSELFCTCWAPSFVYRIFPISLRITWWWMKLNSCGIKLDRITIFWNIETRSEEEKENILKNITI